MSELRDLAIAMLDLMRYRPEGDSLGGEAMVGDAIEPDDGSKYHATDSVIDSEIIRKLSG